MYKRLMSQIHRERGRERKRHLRGKDGGEGVTDLLIMGGMSLDGRETKKTAWGGSIIYMLTRSS
jgi:hypothetical protein